MSVIREKLMNTLQHNQKQGASQSKDKSARSSAVDLAEVAKPIGTFGGLTDIILRFRDGVPVAADTGDQGGGQN
jgi:hypothetical protein